MENQTTFNADPKANGLQISAFDYLELYQENARQALHFYRTAWGFVPAAFSGLETGARDRISFVTEQQDIRLMLTSPLGPDGPIAEHIRLHGDGVKDIAFTVNDAAFAFEQCVSKGARPVTEPTVMENEHGRVVKATIATLGDTVHSFVQRNSYGGRGLPGYKPIDNPAFAQPIGLGSIDHLAIAVEAGELNKWIEFYCEVLGFHTSHQEDILTDYSGMNSKVVQNSTGEIKFAIMEPVAGNRKSQIEEYLVYNHGPGVQHIAFSTGDIFETVKTLLANGIEFLTTPGTYYSALPDRIGGMEDYQDELRRLNILVDRDEWGYLMQVFSRPLQSRPTHFVEVIQRHGARGFGGGNIRALFEAVEREQQLRGNL